MNLVEASKGILKQLAAVIDSIKEDDFSKKIELLNDSTIGQHIRHTLEFFTCLMLNMPSGRINYDKRDHDKVIEIDKMIAKEVIKNIYSFLDNCNSNQTLLLEVNYDLNNETTIEVDTNINRELAYNIEHAIHHLAIIKIGIKNIAPYIKLDPDFGVAISTVKYKKNLTY